ncbi:hypothetical protein MN608_09478 [Microdochium nivale]|nr:hypothetical protein MN608_09478 [Microdochium nivale]
MPPGFKAILEFLSVGILATATVESPTNMAQCYDISGQVNTNFKRCVPGNSTSPCCGETDLCMDNGLCLNAFGNQAYTIQGCTSTNWTEPCQKVCNEPFNSDGAGMYYISYCWDSNPISGTEDEWCCGIGCCKNSTAIKFELPVAKHIYKPGQVEVAPLVTLTTTLTTTLPTTLPTGAPSLATSDFVSQKDYSRMMKTMGGGLGAPLGLFVVFSLFAVVFWFLCVRRWRDAAQSSRATTGSAAGGGYERFNSNQRSDTSPSGNAAPWVWGSNESSHDHNAGHYVPNMKSQPMVEAFGNQSSLSPTSQELADTGRPHELRS